MVCKASKHVQARIRYPKLPSCLKAHVLMQNCHTECVAVLHSCWRHTISTAGSIVAMKIQNSHLPTIVALHHILNYFHVLQINTLAVLTKHRLHRKGKKVEEGQPTPR
jgi:hypothetical protein